MLIKNIKDIQEYIYQIRQSQGHPEVAASMECDLYISFIEYIAAASPPEVSKELKEKAALVLVTQQLNFSRWNVL